MGGAFKVGRVAGIDVKVHWTCNEIMAAAHSPQGYASVLDLIKTNFPTVSPNADLFGEGYRLLQQSGLKALPVVEGSKLVGMLTLEDVGHASLGSRQQGGKG